MRERAESAFLTTFYVSCLGLIVLGGKKSVGLYPALVVGFHVIEDSCLRVANV